MQQETYRQRIIQRHRHRQRRLKADMHGKAVRLARLAAEQFRFRRIYLFGSVTSASRLAAWSDIDLAVEGLATEDFWRLVGMLSADAKYPLDVKSLDDIPAASRQEITTTGVVLYEAP